MIQRLIRNYPILCIILLLAFIIRLVAGHVQSFSNDELSALYRLQYSNFYDLMYWGVQVDNHPALVQLFLYYYVQLVPKGEVFVRLPFILATTCSLGYVFFSMKKLSGEFAAYMVTIILAFAGFSIQMGYFARPYAFGILFTSAATYYWIRIFIDKEKGFKYLLFFTLCCILAAYTHYLALLQIAILGAATFVFSSPRLWWKILVAAFFSLLAFAPHYTITKYHLSVGGIGAWLGKANNAFIIDMWFEYFDRSAIILGFFLLVAFASILMKPTQPVIRKLLLLGFLSVTPYMILYFYSVKVNPLLQYSAGFFLMPYLLGLFFSGFETSWVQSKMIKWVYVGLIMVFLSSTLYTYSAFAPIHFAEFKKIAAYIEEHESDSVTTVVAVNNPFYIDYYLKDKKPDLYITDMYDNLNFLRKYIDTCKSVGFIYAFTNDRSNMEIPFMIRNRFYHLQEVRYYMNSELMHFSLSKMDAEIPIDPFQPLFEYGLNSETKVFEKTDENGGPFSEYTLFSEEAFSPSFKIKLSDLNLKPFDRIFASATITGADRCDLEMVLSIENEKESVFWRSRKLSYQYGVYDNFEKDSLPRYRGDRFNIHRYLVIGESLNDIRVDLKEHFLKVYIWNPQGCSCHVTRFTVSILKGNPLVTGYSQ